MSLRTITIAKPSDMHTHVREGKPLKKIVQVTAKNFANILVMPNTNPAKTTASLALAYKREIEKHTSANIIGTIKITPDTNEGIIADAVRVGIIVGKLYFGITTNETEGARGIEPYFPALTAMQKHGMILSIHGEMAYDHAGKKIINLRREEAFIPIAKQIVKKFPKLKIVMEHISTAAMVKFVEQAPKNVAATITVQHLRDDIDAVLGFMTESGEGINAHNYCKPVLKMPEDRIALIYAATSGDPKFFFGSDSAPHPKELKECCCGKPGVFNAMTRIETVCEIFEKEGALRKLNGFLSLFGPRFYGLPKTTEKITLVKSPWVVPAQMDEYVNYRQSDTIAWQVAQ